MKPQWICGELSSWATSMFLASAKIHFMRNYYSSGSKNVETVYWQLELWYLLELTPQCGCSPANLYHKNHLSMFISSFQKFKISMQAKLALQPLLLLQASRNFFANPFSLCWNIEISWPFNFSCVFDAWVLMACIKWKVLAKKSFGTCAE